MIFVIKQKTSHRQNKYNKHHSSLERVLKIQVFIDIFREIDSSFLNTVFIVTI